LANADIAVRFIDAGSTVSAGPLDAFVEVVLAESAGEAIATLATKGIYLIYTNATVLTGVFGAIVNVVFAMLSRKPNGTTALIPVEVVHAGGTINARPRRTLVPLDVAVATLPTVRTGALESIWSIQARCPVLTR
jgi:hypothetical protein